MCLAIPGKIIEINRNHPERPIGKVDFGGVIKNVELVFTPEAKPDDYVIVHVGFALSILDEDAANEVFRELERIESQISPQADE